MSTITRERLEELAAGQSGFNLRVATPEESMELARIALASLEPININDDMAFAFCRAITDDAVGADEVWPIKLGLRAAFANVATPPAPVVPEALLSAMEEVLRISDRDHEAWHQARAGIVACRAAMLQGADGVLTNEDTNHQEDNLDMVDHSGDANEKGNSPVVPDGLRLALSNAGIAAPESDEMLAATCEKYIQALVTWVKDRKPFQSEPQQVE